ALQLFVDGLAHLLQFLRVALSQFLQLSVDGGSHGFKPGTQTVGQPLDLYCDPFKCRLLERAEFTDSFDCGIRLVLAANEYFAAEFAAGRLVLALDGQQSRLDSGPKRLGVPVKSFANSVQVTLNTVAHPVNAIRDCPAVRLLQRRELAERLHGT